jgi:photosystem II stability/assembly factor-like uncharacterized protein
MRKFIFSFSWRVFVCLAFLLTGAELSNAQINNQYKWLHQSPQGNTLRYVKMWDANNWYAVGYGATFMKTSNAGATWTVQNNIWMGTSGDYDLAYDAFFVNQNTGWMSGNSGKIVKTTNAGATWDTAGFFGATSATWYGLDFLDANTGFACGTTSGLITKTTDGGATWNQLGTPPSATYYNIYAKDVNNIIATTTTGNIRRTTDGGTTWSTVSTGTSATIYRVNFLDANTGYVCGSSTAIRFTTDFGATWTSTNTGVAASTFYDIDFSSSSLPSPTLDQDFESVTFPPTGWTRVSLLGAKQWSRSTVNPFAGTACAFSDFESTGGYDWLITNSNAVYAGDSLSFWLRRSYTGAFFNWDSLQVYVGTSADTTTMTRMLTIGVNALTDTSGSTYPPRLGAYQRFAVNMSSFAGQNVFIGFRHLNSDGTGIRMDEVILGENRPASQDYVYITGNSFNIYKSPVGQNAFDTVQFLDPTQPWTSTHYATDLSSSGDTLITVGASGLIEARFSPSNRNAYTTYIKAGNFYDVWGESATGRVIAVGSPGIAGSVFDQVMYSTNGGEDWALGNYSASDDQDLNSISMVNATTGYVAGDEGVISKTTDGGVTWTPTTATGSTTELNKVVFANVNTGFAFGTAGQGHKTTDGGVTWSPLTTGMGTSVIYGADFTDANTGWVVGATGKVFKTTDGGANFSAQTSNYTGTLYTISMLNSNTGWISGASGRVRRTTDAGVTWDTADVPFTGTCYSVHFTDADNGMVTSTVGTVYRTRDGGETWEVNNTSASTLYSVYMTNSNRAFIVGTTAGVWQYQETVTGNEITFTNNVPERYFLDQNYPNPFNPTTTIKFGLPREGAVSLKIYDMAGREVANIINNERMNAGIVSYNFNGSALASGVYFYTLVVDNDLIATKKMVLVK